MKIQGDYHIHTKFSDGAATVEEVALKIAIMGLNEFALCDHSFRSYLVGATKDKLKNQKEKLASFSYGKQSIEANILNFNGEIDVPNDVIKNLDMLSMGFHRFVTKGNGIDRKQFVLKNGWSKHLADELIEKNTNAFIKAIENYPIDVVCHLGHRAKVIGKKVFECCKANGCYVELNEKHIDALEPMIEDALKANVNFILGSDAHKPQNIGCFDNVKKIIKKHNIPLDKIVGIEREFLAREK